jgi:hypothetical protein
MKKIDKKLTWTTYPSQYSDVSEVYCADTDKLVSVNKRLSGVYYVTCEFFGDLQGIYATLEEALARGESLLQEYYPEVYAEVQA